MKIILTDGTELNPIVATGGGRFVNGAKRDTLNFIFPEGTSLDELDALFTEANCETIKIVADETEHIHSAYTIRAELSRTPMEVQAATETTEAVFENRVTVSMAQRTYAESQLAKLTEQNAMLEECIVEMAQVVYA